MAGNNSIQILRCNSNSRVNSTDVLLEGQPMIETDTGYFYVGDGVTNAAALNPISMPYATQNIPGLIKIWQNGSALYISTED